MSIRWSATEVASAVGGVLIGSDTEVTSVSVDSRNLDPGAAFVALRGEHFDGHRFAAAAASAGASVVIVESGAEIDPDTVSGTPRIEVPDTATALRDLAALRRSIFGGPVVAVTGSSGKTSTKDLLAAALPGAFASPRSFNNEVGVPLTVLSSPDDAGALVVEVGSRGRGHIRWLMPAVRPDVAIITNLGMAHLEMFGTLEDLADAKWELVEALGELGTAVLPADDLRLRRPHPGTTLTFGSTADGDADVAYDRLVVDDGGLPTFEVHTPSGSSRVRLRMAGAHQAPNTAAAIAAGIALGVELDVLVEGVERAEGSPWRMEIHRGRFTVVNDAYNANPDSMRAALRMVAQMPGRRLAVLGRMGELGPVEAEEHRRVGTQLRDLGFSVLVTVGPDPGMAEGAGDIAVAADDVPHALDLLADLIAPDDVVLVKASRAVGLEKVAERLVEEAGR